MDTLHGLPQDIRRLAGVYALSVPQLRISAPPGEGVKTLAQRQEEMRGLVAIAPKPAQPTGSRLYERHFAPAELAERWSLSEDTIRRMFEKESGVLIFENAERSSSRRR